MRTAILLMAALAADAAAQVRLPEYSRETLPNGAVLDLIAQKGLPLINVRVLVKGGVESDPAEQAGLASITAELLRRGTKTRSAEQFAEELDALGATFGAFVNPQATTISTEFLAKHADRALDLLTDAVLRPAFLESEVKKALGERIDASRSVKDNPQGAIGNYFRGFFYGASHPYGHPANGDEISLKRITRDGIAGYHARTYSGANLIVVAAGEFDAAGMRKKLAAAFGGVPRGEAYVWRQETALPDMKAARLLLVDKPDATQTYFWISNPGIHRKHPDRVPVWLVNTLVGGRFTSMLNQALRVDSGLTYGAGSSVDEDRLAGAFSIRTYTRTDSTVQAIDMALDVMRKLREHGISAEQLQSAKAYLKGIFPTQALETPDQVAAVVAELELFGLTRKEIDELFARIDAVTTDQANAVVQKYFAAGNLVFTLVGNASKIRDGVKKYAPAMVEASISAPGFQVAAH